MIRTVRFAVFIEEGLDEGQEALLTEAMCDLPNDRPWTISPPMFGWAESVSDESSGVRGADDGRGSNDDEGESAGGVHILLPERGAGGDTQLDRRALEDAEILLAWAEMLASEHDLVLSVEYDDEVIGTVSPRGLSRGVVLGLLKPWREDLGE